MNNNTIKTLQPGDVIRITPPFSERFPDEYAIISLAEADSTYAVDVYGDGVGSDFHIEFLEAV